MLFLHLSPSKFPADLRRSHHVSNSSIAHHLAQIKRLNSLEVDYKTLKKKLKTPIHLLIRYHHQRANEMLPFISSLVGAEWLQERISHCWTDY